MHNSVKNSSIVPKIEVDLDDDKSVYQNSFQYVQPLRSKWTVGGPIDRETDGQQQSNIPSLLQRGHKNPRYKGLK